MKRKVSNFINTENQVLAILYSNSSSQKERMKCKLCARYIDLGMTESGRAFALKIDSQENNRLTTEEESKEQLFQLPLMISTPF